MSKGDETPRTNPAEIENLIEQIHGAPYHLSAFDVQGKGWGWKASEAKAILEKR